MKKQQLIIFVKKPEAGRVKTRLAQTIGTAAAVRVYKKLLRHTFRESAGLLADVALYLSTPIEDPSLWHGLDCQVYMQHGKDLGYKIHHAFENAFLQGYHSVGIIGSDCPELSTKILQNALHTLAKTDVVIGPAKDGGYYFLGMKRLYKTVFQNKLWSTNKVLSQTIADCKKLNIRYQLLETLSDIDTEEDLKNFPWLWAKN